MSEKKTEVWRNRVAAFGWRPDTFLVMARLFAQLADQVTPVRLPQAGRRLRSDAFKTTDWDRAYTTMPSMTSQIAASLVPQLASIEPSGDQPAWGNWVRNTFTQVEATMKRLDAFTDQQTGYFTDEAVQRSELKAVVAQAEQQAESIVVELKAVADHLASLMQTGQSMQEWLKAALAGDHEALVRVLSLNPWLSYHRGIATRIQAATAAQDHVVLHRIAHALKHQRVLSNMPRSA